MSKTDELVSFVTRMDYVPTVKYLKNKGYDPHDTIKKLGRGTHNNLAIVAELRYTIPKGEVQNAAIINTMTALMQGMISPGPNNIYDLNYFLQYADHFTEVELQKFIAAYPR